MAATNDVTNCNTLSSDEIKLDEMSDVDTPFTCEGCCLWNDVAHLLNFQSEK